MWNIILSKWSAGVDLNGKYLKGLVPFSLRKININGSSSSPWNSTRPSVGWCFTFSEAAHSSAGNGGNDCPTEKRRAHRVFRSRAQGRLNPAMDASSKPLSLPYPSFWDTVLLWLQCSPGLTRICRLLSSASPWLGLSGVHCHVRFAHWFSTNPWFHMGASHSMKLSSQCWFNFPVLCIT